MLIVKRVIFLLLALTVICPSRVAAQQLLLKHYTNADGLPSDVIYDICQDSMGFIWFATDHGVSRFDGKRFWNVSSEDGLPDNEVFRIKTDQYNRCWLTCYNKKPCYIWREKVYNARNDSLCRQIQQEDIVYAQLFKTGNGQYCLGGKKIGLLNRHSITVLKNKTAFPEIADYFNCGSSDYFMGDGIILQLRDGYPDTILKGEFRTAYHNGNKLFLYEAKGQCLYDVSLLPVFHIDHIIPSPAWINGFFVQPDGSIMCCTEKGLMVYNRKKGVIEKTRILPDQVVANRVFKDAEGNTWYATLNKGVFMQPATKSYSYNAQSGLADEAIYSIAEGPEHQLLAGFDGGFSVIAPGGGIRNFFLPGSGSRNRIRFFLPAGNNTCIIGSDIGLYELDRRFHTSAVFMNVAQKTGFLSGDNCYTGYTDGAMVLNTRRKKKHYYWFKKTTAIVRDHNQTLWFGTLDGLFFLSAEDSITKLEIDPLLSHSRITHLAIAGDKLVISTSQNGLFLLSNRTVTHLCKDSGISSNNCIKAIADEQHKLWVATDRGIDRVDLNHTATGKVPYDLTDRLTTNKINDFLIADGKIIVATNRGIEILDTASENNLQKTPRLHISSIRTRSDIVNNTQNLNLAYSQNELQINFTGISFLANNEVEYKYILVGNSRVDTSYTILNAVNFSALQPGSYRFMVWARNKYGPWTSPQAFTFSILPPFWQNRWVMLTTLLMLTLMIIAYYRYKVKLIRSKAEITIAREREIAELELQALRSQINPHFLFNALNSIQHYYSRNEERKANHYLTSFAKFIRTTLTYSKSQWINLSEEISMLHTYIELEQMRFNNAFAFEIIVSGNIHPELVKIPAMLVQPYVENAIIHGLCCMQPGDGRLVIRFEVKHNTLYCIIDDNGVGISRSFTGKQHQHQSLGRSVTQQRITVLNQAYQASIRINTIDKQEIDQAQNGTRIEIIIPQQEPDEKNNRFNC